MLVLQLFEGVMKGRIAIGFATPPGTSRNPPQLLLLLTRSSEVMLGRIIRLIVADKGVVNGRSSEVVLGGIIRLIVTDEGVVNGAAGCLGFRGVLQVVFLVLLVEMIPKSNEGVSCGGNDRGAESDLVNFAFFCLRSESGSFIVRGVFLGRSGVAGAEVNCIGSCGIGGRGGKVFCCSIL